MIEKKIQSRIIITVSEGRPNNFAFGACEVAKQHQQSPTTTSSVLKNR
jgi:hypothetical protein